MKPWCFARISLFVVAATLVATSVFAQGFHAVTSKDGTDVWAVGDAGQVYRSFDGGVTYTATILGAGALRGIAHRGFGVLVVGDGGVVYRSTNNGGTFTSQTIGGGQTLRGVVMTADGVAYTVGDAGRILRSDDGGVNWVLQTSGTAQRLNGVAFTDSANGWACGGAGTLLRTTNGGTSWASVAAGTTRELFLVAQSGSEVWVVGADATALRSTTGGAPFSPVNLHVDAHPEVRTVAFDGTTVWLGGGGGFIRSSADGGASWNWPVHDLYGQTSAIALVGSKLFAASNKYKAITRSANGGATWALPTGMTLTRSWASVTSTGSFRGATWAINGFDSNILYIMRGNQIVQSRDRGETWSTIATVSSPSISTANAFVVSPDDSNTFVAAVDFTGGSRGVIQSTNRGVTWTTTLTHAFGTYGIPLEQHPDDPTTIVFGGDNDRLYVSTDRGKTFAPYGTKVFRSPCDIVIVPDQNNTWQVGDGITGSGTGDLWLSNDSGDNFAFRQLANGSEVPGMSIARARNTYTVGTTWGANGPRATSDQGVTWPVIGALSSYGSSWGTDIARDDPNVVIIGQYSGGVSRVSTDGGATFASISLSGTNYSFMAVDRSDLFAEQSSTMYKMRFVYGYTPSSTQSLLVTAPNGGESWAAGSTHAVNWNASNVGLAHLEWRASSGDAWQPIADIEGYLGTYDWVVPDVPTTTAELRISDAVDGTPIDASNGTFTILAPRVVVTPASHDFGAQGIGSATTFAFNVQSTGTTTLDVTDVSTASGAFTEGRTSFSLGTGTSDTVGVTFRPAAAIAYGDTLVLTTNAGVVKLALAGIGQSAGSVSLTSPDGGQSWKYGTVHNITWSAAGITEVALDYRTATANPWIEIVTGLDATTGTYAWTIPNAPTSEASVRVRDLGGSISDVSASTFAITVPAFSANPAPVDVGDVAVNASGTVAVTISNAGTAFLGITSISSNNPVFHVGRTGFNVNAASSDTTGVTFSPSIAGVDSATITFVTDDPATPHLLRVVGRGTSSTGVGGPVPTAFALGNQPNPFASRTTIAYAIPTGTRVQLEVFDIQGHRVATLVNREQAAGRYTVPFGRGVVDAAGAQLSSIPTGVYFYRLRTPEWTSTKRMLMLK